MKKILLFLTLIVCVIGMSGCNSKYTTYEEVTYEQLTQIKEKNETFPLVIGSSTCSACEAYKVTMEAFIGKYNIKVYFIDLDKLTTEEKESLRVETNYDSTPTTVFYENGKITMSYNRLVGAADMQGVKKIFTENGYIK